MADATTFLMNCWESRLNLKSEDTHVNVEVERVSIAALKLIASIVGFKGTINFDHTKPDGAPRKLMDSSNAIAGLGA